MHNQPSTARRRRPCPQRRKHVGHNKGNHNLARISAAAVCVSGLRILPMSSEVSDDKPLRDYKLSQMKAKARKGSKNNAEFGAQAII
ncbi:hypothetical protein PoB_001391500 [Plakobranchus ocellatus]|uniref:Uncharacterized protein n=1 Tax=Plakobranchus ocellatus TaxID=259542 RepID=A0AAV3YW18_9GAST|nr:hypothetical protein PoB_001391500 [Plakobranchus ocellatus]